MVSVPVSEVSVTAIRATDEIMSLTGTSRGKRLMLHDSLLSRGKLDTYVSARTHLLSQTSKKMSQLITFR